MRDKLLTFWVSETELGTIDNNAKKTNKTRSKFVRDRAVRPEMTTNELGNFLMRCFSEKLDKLEVNTGKKIWNKQKELKELMKPKITDMNLIAETDKMTKEQRLKFVERKIQAIDETEGLLSELKERLKIKVDS